MEAAGKCCRAQNCKMEQGRIREGIIESIEPL